MDIAVKLIRDLVKLPLRFPELWTTAGVPPPMRVLLHRPPGCGKTLLANALVKETGAHIEIVNETEIMAHKGGESEANLRQAFERAMEKAPSSMFMDELDSNALIRIRIRILLVSLQRMISRMLNLLLD
jgi:transitional endoplasmic reticulum ATPase